MSIDMMAIFAPQDGRPPTQEQIQQRATQLLAELDAEMAAEFGQQPVNQEDAE